MLNDIFSKKRDKAIKKEKNPKVIVDIHEKNSLVLSNLNELGAELETIKLQVGDYLIGNVIVERKTFQDFISSMLSKRLMIQLNNMKQYENQLLILEGSGFEILENSNVNPNAVRGMILSISLDFKIPVIFTEDSKETAKYLLVLAKRQLKEKTEMSFHSRKPLSKKEKIKYILESFGGIGPKNAKLLLKKFITIKNIINANPEDIRKLIGKKSEAFRIVDEKY